MSKSNKKKNTRKHKIRGRNLLPLKLNNSNNIDCLLKHSIPNSCQNCEKVCSNSIWNDFHSKSYYPSKFSFSDRIPNFIPQVSTTRGLKVIYPWLDQYPFITIQWNKVYTKQFASNKLFISLKQKLFLNFFQRDRELLDLKFRNSFDDANIYAHCNHIAGFFSPECHIEPKYPSGYGQAIWNYSIDKYNHLIEHFPTIAMIPYDPRMNRAKNFLKQLIDSNPIAIGMYKGKYVSEKAIKRELYFIKKLNPNIRIILTGIGDPKKIVAFAKDGVDTFVIQNWEIKGSKRKLITHSKHDKKILEESVKSSDNECEQKMIYNFRYYQKIINENVRVM